MLPSGYVVAHVHLGYAATEHGNQGDTTHTAIELVTDTTSRRGLYVGATRGRTENLMLVVTESHDLDEARDILERVLINDRVDLPAIAQRRQLAEAARPVPPGPQRPASRCTIPDWFDKLEADIDARLRKAVEADQRIDAMEQRLRHQLAEAEQRHQEAERLLDPHRLGLEDTHSRVEAAKRRVWSANSTLNQASRRRERTMTGIVRSSSRMIPCALR